MITWGIIGAGDVAEVKSGPAFNKIDGSNLLAVMRRNAEKAADFARRHNVPLWYSDAEELLQNEEINSVYIATPPSSHKELTITALNAGKNVYLEKPMAMSVEECREIVEAAKISKGKISIAHYRREVPAFRAVKEMIDGGSLGKINFAQISFIQPEDSSIVAMSDAGWRVNPTISGGGLFHDLAPHQIDLMINYFGETEAYSGHSTKQKNAVVDDLVSGSVIFKNNIVFQGLWSFCSPEHAVEEVCRITGERGWIEFSFYGEKVLSCIDGKEETLNFDFPAHIQQPMIEKVCRYFDGSGSNPCSAEEGLKVIEIMSSFIS